MIPLESLSEMERYKLFLLRVELIEKEKSLSNFEGGAK